MNKISHRLTHRDIGTAVSSTRAHRAGDPVARYLCLGADGTVHYFLPAP